MSTCKTAIILGKHDICKDCAKADVCKHKENIEKDPILDMSVEQCEYFKDKSKSVDLPFKLGEQVYTTVDGEVEKYRISEIRMNKNDFYTQLSVKCDKLFKTSAYDPEAYDPDRRSKHIEFGVGNINKEVFLTKEEAEQALAERSK